MTIATAQSAVQVNIMAVKVAATIIVTLRQSGSCSGSGTCSENENDSNNNKSS